MSEQVDDLTEILAGRTAVLFGHSYGGNVALAAAARLGSQIRGVATYESPLSWLEWWPTSTAGAESIAVGPAEAAERFMVRLVGQETWDCLPERTREHRRREGVALVGELGALRAEAPWDAGSVHCPVRCGHGTMGSEHHARGAKWLLDNLRLSTMVTIDGAGHGAPNSHPDAVATELILPLVGGG